MKGAAGKSELPISLKTAAVVIIQKWFLPLMMSVKNCYSPVFLSIFATETELNFAMCLNMGFS